MSVKFFRVRSGWDNYVMGDGMGERVGGRRYNRQRVFYLLCSNCLSIGIGSTCDIVVFNPWIWFSFVGFWKSQCPRCGMSSTKLDGAK